MSSMIPTAPTPPKNALHESSILIYGPPKCGKSTWASEIPGALFLPTEEGLDWLSVYQAPTKNWNDILATLAEVSAQLERGEFQFECVVLDTIDNAYRWCEEWVCEKLGIKHPGELDYGKGYGRVYQEFGRVLNKAAALPTGLVLIGHSSIRTVKTKYGERDVIGLTLGDKAARICYDLCSFIFYADLEEDPDGKVDRVVRTKPTTKWNAGDRTGRLPESLPLKWDAFVEAFERSGAREHVEHVAIQREAEGIESQQARHLREVKENAETREELTAAFPDEPLKEVMEANQVAARPESQVAGTEILSASGHSNNTQELLEWDSLMEEMGADPRYPDVNRAQVELLAMKRLGKPTEEARFQSPEFLREGVQTIRSEYESKKADQHNNQTNKE